MSFRSAVAALALAAAPALAQPVPASNTIVAPRLAADADRLVPGKSFRLAVVADIKAGWHVNSHTPKEDFLIPTVVKLKPAPGLAFSAVTYPKHKETKFSFSDQPLAVYEGRAIFLVPGTVDANAAPGPRTLTAVISYQPCNDNQCLPPTELTASLTIEVAKAGAEAKPRNADLFGASASATGGGSGGAPSGDGGPAANAGTAGDAPLGAAALREKWRVQGVPTLLFLGPDGKETGTRVVGFEPPETFAPRFSGSGPATAEDGLAGKSLPILLGLVFVSGLALNLTPCVYPLIPITLGFFSRQSEGKSGRHVRPRARLRSRHERHVLGSRRLRGALGLALRRVAPEAGRARRDRGDRPRARALDVRPLRDPGPALHHGPDGLEVRRRRRAHDGPLRGLRRGAVHRPVRPVAAHVRRREGLGRRSGSASSSRSRWASAFPTSSSARSPAA